MPDYDDDDDLFDDDDDERAQREQEAERKRNDPQYLRRELRNRGKELKERTRRLSELERQLAFRDAGLPSSPLTELFAKSYDGDLNADAIKAEAERVGIIQPEQKISDDQLAQHELAADMSGNAGINATSPKDQAAYEEEINASDGSPAAVLAIAHKYGKPTIADRQ